MLYRAAYRTRETVEDPIKEGPVHGIEDAYDEARLIVKIGFLDLYYRFSGLCLGVFLQEILV
jgi:hypothetical protein